MKKIICSSILVVFLMSFFPMAYAQEELKVLINNTKVEFPDEKPFIDKDSGRTLVPIRFIAETLGSEVDWMGESGLVIIKKGNTRIVLKVGENWAVINISGISDTRREFDTKAVIKNGRVFVPLRFISETLNAKVEWNSDTSTVSIYKENIQ